MKSAVKVMVVEDNPLVRDLLRRGLEPHCELVLETEATDALLRILEEPPDMIISDYRMAGMDGRQLYEKLRSREKTRGIPFIFMASRGDIEEKIRPLVEGVEDFIVKPFFLKDLVRRSKKVIDRLHLEKLSKRASRPGVIQGRLEEMNLLDLFQSLEMGGKSCRLSVVRNGEKCDIYFVSGACKHAVMGAVEGNEPVFKVVAWNDGEFEIDFSVVTDKVTTTMSTQGLLMEGLRLIDEANAAKAEQT
jgi:CheY-like chemotaxis protein